MAKGMSVNHRDLCRMSANSYDAKTGSVNDVEFQVNFEPDHTNVIFRGTEFGGFISKMGFMDVVRDIRIVPWRDKRTGWGHAGFLKGARGVVDGPLRDYITPSMPITLAGHSMGAGVSLFAALMLHSEGYQIKEWVGFGCPRPTIGRKGLPFPATSYRNHGDPVTQVPRKWMGGYSHPIRLTRIGQISGHSIGLYMDALL